MVYKDFIGHKMCCFEHYYSNFKKKLPSEPDNIGCCLQITGQHPFLGNAATHLVISFVTC
jgi:hypothetical protein